MFPLAWLHVGALWTLAVAQPLFDLLGGSPEFFVAHRAGRMDILLLAALLVLAPAAVFAGCLRLIGLAGARAHGVAATMLVAGLSAVIGAQLAVRAGATLWTVAAAAAAAAAVVSALAYVRVPPVRTFLTALGAAILVVPGVFLSRPAVRSLLAQQEAQTVEAGQEPVAWYPVTTPVVLVIFDELPLLSLLDGGRNIDPLLYPNIAALARDGVWYRNATTVNDFTRWSVPAIVSGLYPRREALPSAHDHPQTLFTLLSRTHQLEVSEAVTALCPRALCATAEDSAARRLAAMARDLRVVFLYLVLTPDLTAGLPDPTSTWAGFGGGPGGLPGGPGDDENALGTSPGAATGAAEADARQRWREGIEASRVAPVRQFIDGISRFDAQPTFYFLHTLVSHHPHDMLPGGRRNRTWMGIPGKAGGSWARDQPWAVAQQYQRHLLQVGFVDDLVGDLVSRLKEARLYDDALVVVTADHGISHTPGTPERNFVGGNAAEIIRVPLIFKFPERIRVWNRVSDVNAETVDILPTIADVLRIDLPWTLDGASLLDEARVGRPTKAMFSGATGRRRDLDPAGPDFEPALGRKLRLFGDGSANVHRAPRLPPYDELVGRRLADLRIEDGGGSVELTHAWAYDDVDVSASEIVFDVGGRFGEPRPDTFVAVAVNGAVEAVTRTWESNPRGWLATPRFDAWRQGRNAIEVFVAERDAAGLLLKRTSLAQVRPADLNLMLPSAAAEWGVGQWGFYPLEDPGDGVPFRWTREAAVLSNLAAHGTPRAVHVDVKMVPGGSPKTLRIEAAGCVLFEGPVAGGWSARLPLDGCDLSREGLDLQFTTDAPRGAVDRRRLGVAVSRVAVE